MGNSYCVILPIEQLVVKVPNNFSTVIDKFLFSAIQTQILCTISDRPALANVSFTCKLSYMKFINSVEIESISHNKG